MFTKQFYISWHFTEYIVSRNCFYQCFMFYHISQNRLGNMGIGYTKHVPIFKAGNYDYLLTHPRQYLLSHSS